MWPRNLCGKSELSHWMGTWLAARTVVGVPGVYSLSLHRSDYSLPTAAARFPGPLIHPVLAPSSQLSGGGLLRPLCISQQQPSPKSYHRIRIDDSDRSPRGDTQQEAHLRLIQIPNARHDPLLEQGEA